MPNNIQLITLFFYFSSSYLALGKKELGYNDCIESDEYDSRVRVHLHKVHQ